MSTLLLSFRLGIFTQFRPLFRKLFSNKLLLFFNYFKPRQTKHCNTYFKDRWPHNRKIRILNNYTIAYKQLTLGTLFTIQTICCGETFENQTLCSEKKKIVNIYEFYSLLSTLRILFWIFSYAFYAFLRIYDSPKLHKNLQLTRYTANWGELSQSKTCKKREQVFISRQLSKHLLSHLKFRGHDWSRLARASVVASIELNRNGQLKLHRWNPLWIPRGKRQKGQRSWRATKRRERGETGASAPWHARIRGPQHGCLYSFGGASRRDYPFRGKQLLRERVHK